MLKALLVDMDGTLVDTRRANALAYCAACREHGVSISLEQFDSLSKGQHWTAFLPLLIRSDDMQLCRRIAITKREVYPDFFAYTVVNSLLVEWLRLTRNRLSLALVTTASYTAVMGLLKYHGLQDLFETIVSAEDVSRTKPDPSCYRLAADRLKVSPDECIVLEDSAVGIAAARGFGAMTLVMTTASASEINTLLLSNS